MAEIRKEVAAELNASAYEAIIRGGKASYLIPISDSDQFPALFKLIRLAHQAANESSLRDSYIPEIDDVMMANSRYPAMTPLKPVESGKFALRLSPTFLNQSYEDVLATVTHKFRHRSPSIREDFLVAENKIKLSEKPYTVKTVLDEISALKSQWNDTVTKVHKGQEFDHQSLDESNKRVHLREMVADRAVSDPIAKISSTLRYLMTDPSEYLGRGQLTEHHPNRRFRIDALLQQAYGNSMLSGEFELDEQFHPNMHTWIKESKNGKENVILTPRTEKGEVVVNWYTEIEPAMKKLVTTDMQQLDSLVSSGLNDEKIATFTADIRMKIEAFKQDHVAQLLAPDDAFIAQQFEESLKNPQIIDSVRAMHPQMPKAFAALAQLEEEANHFISKDARNAFLDSGKQHLIDNISKGQYPEPKQAIQNSNELTL